MRLDEAFEKTTFVLAKRHVWYCKSVKERVKKLKLELSIRVLRRGYRFSSIFQTASGSRVCGLQDISSCSKPLEIDFIIF